MLNSLGSTANYCVGE